MANIIISSLAYKQQLIDLYYGDIKEFVTSEGEHGGSFFIVIERDSLDMVGLCELFEDIVLYKNEVLACSPKLCEIVRNLCFVADRQRMAWELEEYFAQNNELCLEGYLNFRLGDVGRKVNHALYSLIKRCLNFGTYRIGETYDY